MLENFLSVCLTCVVRESRLHRVGSISAAVQRTSHAQKRKRLSWRSRHIIQMVQWQNLIAFVCAMIGGRLPPER